MMESEDRSASSHLAHGHPWYPPCPSSYHPWAAPYLPWPIPPTSTPPDSPVGAAPFFEFPATNLMPPVPNYEDWRPQVPSGPHHRRQNSAQAFGHRGRLGERPWPELTLSCDSEQAGSSSSLLTPPQTPLAGQPPVDLSGPPFLPSSGLQQSNHQVSGNQQITSVDQTSPGQQVSSGQQVPTYQHVLSGQHISTGHPAVIGQQVSSGQQSTVCQEFLTDLQVTTGLQVRVDQLVSARGQVLTGQEVSSAGQQIIYGQPALTTPKSWITIVGQWPPSSSHLQPPPLSLSGPRTAPNRRARLILPKQPPLMTTTGAASQRILIQPQHQRAQPPLVLRPNPPPPPSLPSEHKNPSVDGGAQSVGVPSIGHPANRPRFNNISRPTADSSTFPQPPGSEVKVLEADWYRHQHPQTVSGNLTGSCGIETGSSGNLTGSCGIETGSNGNQIGISGNWIGSSGNQTGISGNQTGISGNLTGSSGNLTDNSGNLTDNSGNLTGSSGNQTGSSGNSIDSSGNLSQAEKARAKIFSQLLADSLGTVRRWREKGITLEVCMYSRVSRLPTLANFNILTVKL